MQTKFAVSYIHSNILFYFTKHWPAKNFIAEISFLFLQSVFSADMYYYHGILFKIRNNRTVSYEEENQSATNFINRISVVPFTKCTPSRVFRVIFLARKSVSRRVCSGSLGWRVPFTQPSVGSPVSPLGPRLNASAPRQLVIWVGGIVSHKHKPRKTVAATTRAHRKRPST